METGLVLFSLRYFRRTHLMTMLCSPKYVYCIFPHYHFNILHLPAPSEILGTTDVCEPTLLRVFIFFKEYTWQNCTTTETGYSSFQLTQSVGKYLSVSNHKICLMIWKKGGSKQDHYLISQIYAGWGGGLVDGLLVPSIRHSPPPPPFPRCRNTRMDR